MATAKKKPAKRRSTPKRARTQPPQVDRGPSAAAEQEAAVAVEQREVTSGPTDQNAKGLDYQPQHPSLENAGLDQHSAEANRVSEKAEQRAAHNERVGGAGEGYEDEEEEQRELHRRRSVTINVAP